MREQFIDLQGMDAILLRMQKEVRTDEMGDVMNDAEYVEQPMKAVFDLSKYFRVNAAYQNATTDQDQRLTVSVKLGLNISIGDRVRFTTKLSPLINEDKDWHVSDVKIATHGIPIAKTAFLTPLRDSP